MKRAQLKLLYRRLYRAYGPQHWWSADGPFEIMVGAVLTQNTSWKNVLRAIAALKQSVTLDAESIFALPPRRLARLLRPSGFFNVKTHRLRNLCEWMLDHGDIAGMRRMHTRRLRAGLLGVNGIGPETADDILLYAFNRPVFVIDAYTRRLLARHGMIDGEEPYEVLRGAIETALSPDVRLYNEYHALIVRHAKERHAKERCLDRRDCRQCRVEAPLRP